MVDTVTAAAPDRWYALQMQPNSERAVTARLKRLGFVKTYSPKARVEVVRRGRVLTVQTAAFPSYLLCEMPPTPAAWRAASDAEGVNRMLGKDERGTPTPLRRGEVEDIRRREGLGQLEPPRPRPPFPGCRVRVRFGHFVNLVGRCVKRHRQRARVSLGLLGGEVELDIPLRALEVVEPADEKIGRAGRTARRRPRT